MSWCNQIRLRVLAVAAFVAALGPGGTPAARGAVGGTVSGTTPSVLTRQIRYVDWPANLHAVSRAVAANTRIIVGPGTYTTAMGATNLFRDTIDWHFEPGVIISNFANVAGIDNLPFDNAIGVPGAIKSRVTGDAVLIHRGGDLAEATAGMIWINNAGSDIYFECSEILLSADTASMNGIYVQNAKRAVTIVKHRLDAAYGPTETGGVSAGNAMWFDSGEWYSDCPNVFTSGRPALYSQSANPGNWYGRHPQIVCTNSSAILWIPSHAQNKLWLECQEITGNSFGSFGHILQQTGGKVYLTAQKLGTFGATRDGMIQQSDGYLWINAQKITTTNLAPWMLQSGGVSTYQVQHWEDAGLGAGGRPYNWALLGGTNQINGGRAYTFTAPGYYLSNNTARGYLSDLLINTRGGAQSTNAPVWLTGTVTNLMLNACTLLAPWEQGAHAVSNNVGSTPILLGGACSANTNLHANVVAVGGTLTVHAGYGFNRLP